ncbi:MAG: hypothetical protein JW818_03345, partial [Pirellulales bacterium]|nr:hypothetical protein [Pirellulales bacterium]
MTRKSFKPVATLGNSMQGDPAMTARERIRLRRIQTAAEGYLELGLPEHALAVLSRLGDLSHYNSHAL